MRRLTLLLTLLALTIAAQSQTVRSPLGTAKWIAAPWSTPRDGAELDGSHPMPIFRREFQLHGKVTHAELRISGLGQFYATINGLAVGEPGLHQSWTDFKKTITFQTYDLTKSVNTGPNTLEVTLGNGMYNVQRTKGRYTKFEDSFGPPKLIAELHLTYVDGRSEVIATDETWKAIRGPILFNSIYGGEDYDAQKDPSLRNANTVGSAIWESAAIVDGPGGRLIPALAPEVELTAKHKPIGVTHPGSNITVYDLGQNFAGIPQILVNGPAGATLKLTPGELLKPDGTISQASSGGPMWWSYTLSGTADYEVWRPFFSYYGFRYIQAEWVNTGSSAQSSKSMPNISDLFGIELHSASPVTGTFTSSNKTINAIHNLIVAAMHNNTMSIFTDCPHREKLGWLEETHLIAPGLLFNNDLLGLYKATDRNIADAQLDDGQVPTIVPQYTVFGGKNAVYDDSPEWGSASILAPWAAYRFYGDAYRSQLYDDYPVMQRYLAYLQSRAKDGIVAYGLGDWYDIGPGNPGFSKLTTLGVTGTLMLYEDAATLSKIATFFNYQQDAIRYAALAESTKQAFNAKFFNPALGYYDTGSQTAQAMPLALGIVPEDAKEKVLAHLIGDIKSHNDHITTGEIGFPYLVRTLMQTNHNDLLLSIMLQPDPPSYAAQLAAGATALTEAWDANPKSSQDHFMLGEAEEWFYRGLGGIDIDMSRTNPAERLTIQPRLVPGLDSADVTYQSVSAFPYGPIESKWTRHGAVTHVEITIPRGPGATIILPNQPPVQVSAGIHHFNVPN